MLYIKGKCKIVSQTLIHLQNFTYNNNLVLCNIGGKMRKGLIFILYGILLHIFLIILLVKSNAFSLIHTKLFPSDKPVGRTYVETHAFYKRVNNNLTMGHTIFLGDSHIQGLAVSEVIGKSVNFGIGKDVTKRLINRVRDYDAISRAKNIVIAIGINDLAHQSVESTIKQFEQLFSLLPKESFLYVHAIFFIDEKLFKGNIENNDIIKLNNKLKQLVSVRKKSEFIDINNQLITKGQLSEEYHIGDGMHLNAKGYKIWIDILKQTITK